MMLRVTCQVFYSGLPAIKTYWTAFLYLSIKAKINVAVPDTFSTKCGRDSSLKFKVSILSVTRWMVCSHVNTNRTKYVNTLMDNKHQDIVDRVAQQEINLASRSEYNWTIRAICVYEQATDNSVVSSTGEYVNDRRDTSKIFNKSSFLKP